MLRTSTSSSSAQNGRNSERLEIVLKANGGTVDVVSAVDLTGQTTPAADVVLVRDDVVVSQPLPQDSVAVQVAPSPGGD